MTVHFAYFLSCKQEKQYWGGFFLVVVAGECLSQEMVCRGEGSSLASLPTASKGGGGGGRGVNISTGTCSPCSPNPSLPGPRLCDKKVTKSNFPAPADLLALLPHWRGNKAGTRVAERDTWTLPGFQDTLGIWQRHIGTPPACLNQHPVSCLKLGNFYEQIGELFQIFQCKNGSCGDSLILTNKRNRVTDSRVATNRADK